MNMIVVGAGICGLATAIAMQRHGQHAEVLEAAPRLEPRGKGIWLPPNAMQVLDRLDLATAVAERGVPLHRVETWDRRGRAIQQIDFAAGASGSRWPTVSIRRTELQGALMAALGPDALRLGQRCTQIDGSSLRPTLQLADGATRAADLVVGADGLHSAVRAAVVPAARVRGTGQACFLGLTRFELPAHLRHAGIEVWGGAARFGFSRVADGLVYWFAPTTHPHDPEGTRVVGENDIEALRRCYSRFPRPVPEVLAAAQASEILRIELRDLESLPRWSVGRVVLAGDAAHAMTPNLGQGAAQALEDAWCLAEALAGEREVEAALAAYERRRRPRATQIARTARAVGRLAHLESRWLQSVRNTALRAMPPALMRRQLTELYQGQGRLDSGMP